MSRNFSKFYRENSTQIFHSLVNVFLFLPYFFSVHVLLKSLFAPWKHIVAKKTAVGFSFREWLERLSFNAISRAIGFIMRLALVAAYVLTQGLYGILFPLLLLTSYLLIPVFYVLSPILKSSESALQQEQDSFVLTHSIRPEHTEQTRTWFRNYAHAAPSSLFNVSPLARDWSMGYTPLLDEYTEDLTSDEYQKGKSAAVGRQEVVAQLEQTLTSSVAANAVLVGEEGVGKHTVIDTLAKKVYEGRSNPQLSFKRILKLDLEKVLESFTDQKQREYFFESLLKEASDAGNIILLIDRLDRYVSPIDDRIDLASSLLKFAEGSSVHLIGITTPSLYQKFIFTQTELHSHLVRIEVPEVTAATALEILLKVALELEKRYRLTITYEAVVSAIEKSEFYITHIPFPEKAIELLDATCSSTAQQKKSTVKPSDVEATLSQLTHTPIVLTDELKQGLLNIEKTLSVRILSQNAAITEVGTALRRAFVLLGKRKKPLCSFLFLGPTGVGKTETAKALADAFFRSKENLIRLDMASYQTLEDIQNLIGSQSSGNPGLLTAAVRNSPYSVLLVDEIEKAHKDLLNIFLTILDEGYFNDSLGKRVDCKSLMIIATSNAASDFIFGRLAGHEPLPDQSAITQHLVKSGVFTPEFLNRFDGIVVYKPLTKDDLTLIAKKIIERLTRDYQKLYKATLTVSEATLSTLISHATQPEFGARDLERTIAKDIEDKVAQRALSGNLKEGDIIEL